MGPNLGVAVLKPHDLGAGCSPFLNLFVRLDHEGDEISRRFFAESG